MREGEKGNRRILIEKFSLMMYVFIFYLRYLHNDMSMCKAARPPE